MPVGIGMTINGKLDARFSEATEPVGWQQVSDALAAAKLYWLTTVRKDGRPHITPLIGAWVDSQEGQAFVFCTGPEEQKAKNLAASTAVAVTTGVNTWNDGLDVVVEGNAERVTGVDMVTRLADTVREKYCGEWDFTPEDAGFGHTDASGDSHIAYVYRVSPGKVLAFAKSPHGQTTFRF
jgi:general stress protein 26